MKRYLRTKNRLDLGSRPPCPKCNDTHPWKDGKNWRCRICYICWPVKTPATKRTYKPAPHLPSFEERPHCPRCAGIPISHGRVWECRECGHTWKKDPGGFAFPKPVEARDA